MVCAKIRWLRSFGRDKKRRDLRMTQLGFALMCMKALLDDSRG
jgi:hypothetical protein